MKSSVLTSVFLVSSALFIFVQLNCSLQDEKKAMTKNEMIERGKYLITFGGCNDCHTPKIMTEMGPIPDTTRLLSGQPANESNYNIDPDMVGIGKWMLTNGHLASWVGPWGISYSANLTPDNATGLGAVSEEMFIKILREGKLKGVGRPLLPPMPWQNFAQLTDEDLKSIYAYLRTIKPINNPVPLPVPPDMLASMNK